MAAADFRQDTAPHPAVFGVVSHEEFPREQARKLCMFSGQSDDLACSAALDEFQAALAWRQTIRAVDLQDSSVNVPEIEMEKTSQRAKAFGERVEDVLSEMEFKVGVTMGRWRRQLFGS
eukprot:TRINITY_DN41570_c0_g1_i2.p1 TRINITY_DN41570_c0_g1~~TRINITY_DN41570_c0_g1_i2.p1  ORF type:complete len:129 (-),score=33.29 TRINITY_DN41570_c0_g1_i2:64-420(-)